MNRADMSILTNLIESADGGGYSLPTEVTEAFKTYQAVAALTMTPADTLDEMTAVTRILAAVQADKDPAIASLAKELEQSSRAELVAGYGQRALAQAVEQAGTRATSLVGEMAMRSSPSTCARPSSGCTTRRARPPRCWRVTA